MVLKILSPYGAHEATIYGDIIKIREVADDEPAQDSGKTVVATHVSGEERTIVFEKGWAFVMNDDGRTIDRL